MCDLCFIRDQATAVVNNPLDIRQLLHEIKGDSRKQKDQLVRHAAPGCGTERVAWVIGPMQPKECSDAGAVDVAIAEHFLMSTECDPANVDKTIADSYAIQCRV